MKQTVIIFLLLSVLVRTQNICAAGLTSSNAETEITQELSIQGIEVLFKGLDIPRKGNFFNHSIRFKKYELVKKNIVAVKKYLEATNWNGGEQRKKKQDTLKLLYDQALWIDGFTLGHLKYFSSPYYAERFLKKYDNIINVQIPDDERKKNDK